MTAAGALLLMLFCGSGIEAAASFASATTGTTSSTACAAAFGGSCGAYCFRRIVPSSLSLQQPRAGKNGPFLLSSGGFDHRLRLYRHDNSDPFANFYDDSRTFVRPPTAIGGYGYGVDGGGAAAAGAAAVYDDRSLYIPPAAAAIGSAAAAAAAAAASFGNHLDYGKTLDRLFHCTNKERRQYSLPELHYNRELAKAAQSHAEDMAACDFFSHTGLNDGSTLGDRVKQRTNYRWYTSVAENLSWHSPYNDPEAAVQGWMQSPGHRKNLLDPEYSDVGFGYAIDCQNDRHYYVQVFGRLMETPSQMVHGRPQTLTCLFNLIQEARANENLHGLAASEPLYAIAQEHADKLAHTGSMSTEADTCNLQNQYRQVATQTCYHHPFNDPHKAVEQWRTTNRYFLKPVFSELGLGYAEDSINERHYYVMVVGAEHDDRGGSFPRHNLPLTSGYSGSSSSSSLMNQRWLSSNPTDIVSF